MYFGDKQHEISMCDIKRAAYIDMFDHLKKTMSLQKIVVLDQQHTNIGVCVDEIMSHKHHSLYEFKGDFIVTSLKHCGLFILTADCLPVVLYDMAKSVMGVAHVGWRGSVAGVVIQALQTMKKQYKCSVKDIHVFYGANAKTCCYNVGVEFPEHFTSYAYAQKAFIKRDNKLYFDNKQFVSLQLQQVGINYENIHNKCSSCTICHQGYCSARREKEQAGRQVTVAALI